MRDERRDLRTFLEGLAPEEWMNPSLCRGWTVRDVVAHLMAWDNLLVYRSRSQHARALVRFMLLYTRSTGSMDRLNRHLDSTTTELSVDDLRRRFAADDSADLKWLFDGTNPAAHLAEYVIHHQDIRGPIEAPRQIPADRLVAALDGVTKLPGVRWSAWRQLRERCWIASDVAWARGRGPTTTEDAEIILMVLAGRPVAGRAR